jgi:hypothetical protein
MLVGLRRSLASSGPNTKVSWTMVGSLTHPVRIEVSRGMDQELRRSTTYDGRGTRMRNS